MRLADTNEKRKENENDHCLVRDVPDRDSCGLGRHDSAVREEEPMKDLLDRIEALRRREVCAKLGQGQWWTNLVHRLQAEIGLLMMEMDMDMDMDMGADQGGRTAR